MEQFTFYTFAAITVLSALGVVVLRNVLHSALLLGLSLLGVAGLFAQLGADFLFASQVLIYVGGIAVLILFVVLLSGRASELVTRQTNGLWAAAAFICAVLLWGIGARVIKPFQTTLAQTAAQPTTAAVGRLMMSDLAVPFELISLILLAALAGAVVFSRSDQEEGEPESQGPADSKDLGGRNV